VNIANSALLAAVLCAALALAQPAQANIVLTGGQAGTTTGPAVNPPGATGQNDLIYPLYGGTSTAGYAYGDLQTGGVVTGALTLTTASTISFGYLGSEAGYNNGFEISTDGGVTWQTLKTTGGKTDEAFATGQSIGSGTFGPGLIDFRFTVDNGAANITNDGGACADCSLFVTFLDSSGNPTSAKSGSVVDVLLNDGGTDADYDDMAIRFTVTAVPVPAALPIIGVALAGFGFAGFKSRRHAA
jgi:hypothetical protein